jgi:hypothetical protein
MRWISALHAGDATSTPERGDTVLTLRKRGRYKGRRANEAVIGLAPFEVADR